MASISCSARSDDNYSYDDCYGTPAMNYWEAIPDSRPLCDRYQDFNWRPGTPAPTCVTDHEMDTRRSPCTKGETAKILREGTYDGGSQSGNMYDFNLGRSYGIQVFECR